MQLLHDARAAGEAIAKKFVDDFEAHNKSPTAEELTTLEIDANQYFGSMAPHWTDAELVRVWREAMVYHVAARIKAFQRPARMGSIAIHSGPTQLAHPERGWSGPFGICR